MRIGLTRGLERSFSLLQDSISDLLNEAIPFGVGFDCFVNYWPRNIVAHAALLSSAAGEVTVLWITRRRWVYR